jgi:hypothetical protein
MVPEQALVMTRPERVAVMRGTHKDPVICSGLCPDIGMEMSSLTSSNCRIDLSPGPAERDWSGLSCYSTWV